MDYPTRLDFCDGKYTVIYDFSTGQSECLRYGQPWRQLVGDKMVLAMFDRVVELQTENAALKNKLEMAEACLAGDGALIEGLKAELAAAQKDAERYRWLRDGQYWPAAFYDHDEPEPLRGEELDAAIDKAMEAK